MALYVITGGPITSVRTSAEELGRERLQNYCTTGNPQMTRYQCEMRRTTANSRPIYQIRFIMAKKKRAKLNKKIGAKVAKIMKEGIRRNTHAPVSSKNKRRKVSQKQAVAVAFSMAKRGK